MARESPHGGKEQGGRRRDNPLLEPSGLPFGFPRFDRIEARHFRPAFDAAMAEHRAEVRAIADSPEPPTFENTLVALERAGRALTRVRKILSQLTEANTDDELRALQVELAPELAAHDDAVLLDEALFARVGAVARESEAATPSPLDGESRRLAWRWRQDMVRAGAELASPEDKAALRALNEEISTLEARFGQLVLEERKASAVRFDDEAELEGLSREEVEAARGHGSAGRSFLVKLTNTTRQPVLERLARPESRRRVMEASLARGARGGEFDSRGIVCELARKRCARARLLGYESHAAYVLADEMVGTPERAMALLESLAPPALAAMRREAEDLRALASGKNEDLTAADWDFYSAQLRARRYSFDAEALKPYFELERVVNDGLFFTAERLYGLRFVERSDLPSYCLDGGGGGGIRFYDVIDGYRQIGLFWMDSFARDSKSGGAWMCDLVSQSSLLGQLPVVGNHSNVPPPAPSDDPEKPVLLTLDEVTTLWHEFGHALHGLLSDVRFERFSGTSVSRDFVEFPSQVNEIWATFPEVLRNYARHAETGEPIPEELVAGVKAAAEKHNVGYNTVEYLGACLLDMAWHSFTDPSEVPEGPDGFAAFEERALAAHGWTEEDRRLAPPRYRSAYFAHAFAGGYEANYASYVRSEILDADGERYFLENGGLTRANGERFRRCVLSRGGTADPNELARAFLGREPSVEALLARKGFSSSSGAAAAASSSRIDPK